MHLQQQYQNSKKVFYTQNYPTKKNVDQNEGRLKIHWLEDFSLDSCKLILDK